MPLALASLLFSWEPGRYLPNSPFEQPHTVICLLSTFWLVLYKHFPSARPQTAAHLRLPPCLLASPAQASAGGAPCKQLSLWGSVFSKAASSFRRSFTRLALTSMSYSGTASEKCFAPEKYWSALLQMVGESIAPIIKDKSQPNPMELMAA